MRDRHRSSDTLWCTLPVPPPVPSLYHAVADRTAPYRRGQNGVPGRNRAAVQPDYGGVDPGKSGCRLH